MNATAALVGHVGDVHQLFIKSSNFGANQGEFVPLTAVSINVQSKFSNLESKQRVNENTPHVSDPD